MRIDQRHYDVKPTDRIETWMIYILSFVFLGSLAIELLNPYEPRKLTAIFFIL